MSRQLKKATLIKNSCNPVPDDKCWPCEIYELSAFADTPLSEPDLYVDPTPREIPLIATGAPNLNDSDVPSMTTLCADLISDGGCNLALRYIDWGNNECATTKDAVFPCIQCSLDAAARANIKLIIRLWMPTSEDPATGANLHNIYDKSNKDQWDGAMNGFYCVAKHFKNHPALGGWQLCDEPAYCVFGQLARAKRAVLAAYEPGDNPPLIFANLYPAEAGIKSLNGRIINENKEIVQLDYIKSYEQYLEEYVRYVLPGVISYDFYAFHQEKANDGTYVTIFRPEIFSQVKRISDFSKQINRPFWAYVQSMSREEGSGDSLRLLPKPTLGIIRLEAFIALAYGAKGILYWRYFSPAEMPETGYKSADAPIVCSLPEDSSDTDNTQMAGTVCESLDQDKYILDRSDTFDLVKKVNAQIAKHANIFLDGKLKAVYCRYGKPEYQNRFADVEELPESMGIIQDIQADSAGVLVSFFELNGQEYVVIINMDYEVCQRVSITFNKQVICYTGYESEGECRLNSEEKPPVWPGPGEGESPGPQKINARLQWVEILGPGNWGIYRSMDPPGHM